MKIIAVVLPHLTFEHIKETFFHMYSSHGLPNLRNLLFQILRKRPPLLFLFPQFFSWACHDTTTNVLFCLMVLWYHDISTSSTLVCVLCITLLNLLQLWHRWNGSWFTLIWYHKHRQTHTGHAATNIFTLTYKYTLTSPDMCALQLPVLHWLNNFLIKKFTLQRFTMSLLLKNFSLIEVIHLLITFNNSKSFLWNTKNTVEML